MLVVTQEETGGPDVLHVAERPVPRPGEGEILVRIAAAGINPVDLAVRAGAFPLIGEPPFVLGWDIGGMVEEMGPGVSGFSVGDRVMGLARFPGQAAAYAQYAAVPAAEMVKIPSNVTDADAAAVPLAGLTAWQALVETAGLKPGQRVLVHAGAGGVGHLAIQIALVMGGHVATTVSAGKMDYVKSLGAHEIIDYRAGDFADHAADFDIVLESIAGEHAERSLKVLKPGGTIICLKAPSEAAERLAREGICGLIAFSSTPTARAC